MGKGLSVEDQRTPAQRRADAAARAQRRAQRRDGGTPAPVYAELFGDDAATAWTDEPLVWTEGDRAPAASPGLAASTSADVPRVAVAVPAPADDPGPPRLPRTRRPGRDPAAPVPAHARRPRGTRAARSGGTAGVPATTIQQRRIAALFAAAAVAAVIFWVAGLGTEEHSGTTASAARAAVADTARPQLPGGGRRLFPDRRVVAFAGNPHAKALGALGVGSDATMIRRLRAAAAPYARTTRPVLPALELITSVATAEAGARGDHVTRLTATEIDRYLKLARRNDMLLLLDVQPGMVDFPRELSRLRRWLAEPDVGLALDPEWRVEPGQIPGQVIGSVSAQEVNATSLALSQIVKENDLPQKLFVVHQFTDGMIRDPGLLVKRPGLATVFNVDGVGGKAEKIAKYKALTANKPGYFHGFKLFYSEDDGLMKPRSVMAMTPRPDLIVLE